mmetsp:Transcript_26283/g.84324  ORF Transcript_26283/g.84324 Transcript_26283/m.84324 type:complete len:531 (+) Transcript_26283:852-2444(+)
MNLLEERLRHSNSAVVLAATKVFLELTQDMPQVHAQVYARLKAPMMTLIAGGVFEQGFICLKHIALLTTRVPDVFAAEYKHFYCKYNEPSCVKLLKLDILTAVATQATVPEIVDEIAEYITEPDANVARAAVAAIGKLGVRVPECGGGVVEQLLKLLEVDIDHVSAEAIIAMKNLLRKFPDRIERFIGGIGTFFRNIDEPDAKVALLWMVGEYGHVIPEAPYLLEPLIDNFAEETSQAVRLELLAATVRLFFRRPAELQQMLGRLLDAAIADASFTDVHDRAMLYYRLLQLDLGAAERILCRSEHVSGQFVEEVPSELQDRIFEEFNSLAVIYGEPSERFVKPELLQMRRVATNGNGASNGAAEHAGAGGGSDDDESDEESDDEPTAAPPPPPAAAGGGIDLLGLEDALPAPAAALALAPGASLDPAVFQQQWGALPTADSWQHRTSLSVPLEQLSARFGTRHVKTMAFGTVGDASKFYFFAREAGAADTLLLCELVVTRSTGVAAATIKATAPAPVPLFSSLVRELLSS